MTRLPKLKKSQSNGALFAPQLELFKEFISEQTICNQGYFKLLQFQNPKRFLYYTNLCFVNGEVLGRAPRIE